MTFIFSHHAFCSSRFVASHPSPFLPSAHSSLPSLTFYQPLSSLHVVTRARPHAHSFPTLNLLYLCVLNCPSPPSLPEIHLTSFPFMSELYQNPSVHSLSSYASVSHSPALSSSSCSWLDYYYFPKWISVLTIQHLEWIFKEKFLKLLSSKWIIMHSTQLEFIK